MEPNTGGASLHGLPAGKSGILQPENQFETPLNELGGADRHKIDYRTVAAKSKCVGRNVIISCIINTLF
jgi:hypothetical protein